MAEAHMLNPAQPWTHYSYAVHDAVHLLEDPRSSEVQPVKRGQMLAGESVCPSSLRVRHTRRGRQGSRRLQGGARVPRRGAAMKERLGADCSSRSRSSSRTPRTSHTLERLLSSNAAILVEPGRVQLLHGLPLLAERAGAIASVEAVQTRRNLYAEVRRAPRRPDWLGIPIDHRGSLPRAPGGRPGARAAALGAWSSCARSEGQRGARGHQPVGGDSLAEGRVVGRSEREITWDLVQRMHELGAEDAAFSAVVAGRRRGCVSPRRAERPANRGGGDARSRRRLQGQRLLSGLHADVLDREGPG